MVNGFGDTTKKNTVRAMIMIRIADEKQDVCSTQIIKPKDNLRDTDSLLNKNTDYLNISHSKD